MVEKRDMQGMPKKETIMKRTYLRWAVAYKDYSTLGPGCWPNYDGPWPAMTRIFNTRQEAREALETLTSYKGKSRVVKVKVSIESVPDKSTSH